MGKKLNEIANEYKTVEHQFLKRKVEIYDEIIASARKNGGIIPDVYHATGLRLFNSDNPEDLKECLISCTISKSIRTKLGIFKLDDTLLKIVKDLLLKDYGVTV